MKKILCSVYKIRFYSSDPIPAFRTHPRREIAMHGIHTLTTPSYSVADITNQLLHFKPASPID